MLDLKEIVAFVGAGDLSKSHRFYGGLLGLNRIEATEFANVYDVGGTHLRITRVDRPAASPYTVLGWRVRDIADTVATLVDAGVAFSRYEGIDQNSLGIWKAPGGSLVAWFSDPDGNTLSVQQSPDLA